MFATLLDQRRRDLVAAQRDEQRVRAEARRFNSDHNTAVARIDAATAAVDHATAALTHVEQDRLASAILKQQRARDLARQEILAAAGLIAEAANELMRLDDEAANVGVRHPAAGTGAQISHLAERIKLTASGAC